MDNKSIENSTQVLLKQQRKKMKDLCAFVGITDAGMRRVFARNSADSQLLVKMAEFFDVSVLTFFPDTKDGENLSTLAEVVPNRNTPTVPSDVAAAYLKGKRDGYDEALALMGTASKENKKQAV